MRQFLLAAPVLFAFGIATANAAPTMVGKSPCPDPTKAFDATKFQRLNELPPGKVFQAVYRLNEGCPAQSLLASDHLRTVPKQPDQKPRPVAR
jgi:hypothetical protein